MPQKRHCRSINFAIITAFSFSLTCMLPAPAALGSLVVDVRIEPPIQSITVGDIFSVDIVADIPEPVVGFGLDFSFVDGTILSQFGPPVIAAPPWTPASASDGDGLAAVAFPNSVSGNNILLATITLSADIAGATDLLLSVTPGDLAEGFPLDPIGFAPVTFQAGHVLVIPEPSVLSLLAFAATMLLHRRRHSELTLKLWLVR